MGQSIPASQLVGSTPGVLGAGGAQLGLNGVLVDNSGDTSIPIGTVQPFPSLVAVQNWYGAVSPQAVLAGRYFGGFTNATQLPNTLFFTQYPTAAVAAYLRSGSLSALSLTALQAFSGTLDITIDGRAVISAAINLSSATSFSNAASLIQTGLQTPGGVFTGTASFASTVMTVATVGTGALHVGDVVTAVGVTAGTTIISFGTGTGGVGTYNLSVAASTEATEAVTVATAATVSFDSLRQAFVVTSATTGATSSVGFGSGAFAIDLLMTAATGAVQSIGAAAAVPAAFMNNVVNAQQNWATFTTVIDPDAGTEPATVKLAFAAWVNSVSPAGAERFCYAGWDSDVQPTLGTASGSFGAAVQVAAYNGVEVIYDLTAGQKAAFFMGATASINFSATQGRIAYDAKSQAGLVPDVVDGTVAQNLQANGYNFYGNYSEDNSDFNFYEPGSISGQWLFADAYINQIQLNSSLRSALLTYKASVNSIPYNAQGRAGIRSAMLPSILAAVNFGSIQSGVVLSASQAQQVNTAAGVAIDGVLSSIGWYLQILPGTSAQRQNRTSPPITLWYTDGGSVRTINFASIDIL